MSFLLFFSLLTVPPSSIVCWFLYSICVSSSNLAEIINNSFIFHDAHSSPFSIGEVDIAQRVFFFLNKKKISPPFFFNIPNDKFFIEKCWMCAQMYVPICGSCSFIRSFDFITFPSFLLEGEGGEGICSPLIMTRSLYLVMFEYTGERIQSLVWWIPAGVTEQMFDKPFFLSFFFWSLFDEKYKKKMKFLLYRLAFPFFLFMFAPPLNCRFDCVTIDVLPWLGHTLVRFQRRRL